MAADTTDDLSKICVLHHLDFDAIRRNKELLLSYSYTTCGPEPTGGRKNVCACKAAELTDVLNLGKHRRSTQHQKGCVAQPEFMNAMVAMMRMFAAIHLFQILKSYGIDHIRQNPKD